MSFFTGGIWGSDILAGGGGTGGANFWIAISEFTSTPASTSTLTMTADLTGTIMLGMGLRYTIGGTVYYGMCTAITSSLMTVCGAPLSGDVSALYWTHIKPIPINVRCAGEFAESASDDLFADFFPPGNPLWKFGRAHFVNITLKTTSDDSGATTQPAVNVVINSNNALNTALTIPDGTEVSSVVQLTPANCVIVNGNSLALSLSAASGGTPGNDALDLGAILLFIPEMS